MTFTLNDIITTKIPKYSKCQHLFKHKVLLSVTKNFQNIENQLFYLENILLKIFWRKSEIFQNFAQFKRIKNYASIAIESYTDWTSGWSCTSFKVKYPELCCESHTIHTNIWIRVCTGSVCEIKENLQPIQKQLFKLWPRWVV